MEPEWVRIDSARNVSEAGLMRAALESEGIEVGVRGEHLPSIAGELPLPEAKIEIWVRREHEARAREVLESFHRPPEDLPSRLCPQCGEENPGNFGRCWKCESALPADA